MIYYPTLPEFEAKAKEGNLIPVYAELLADMDTPVSAFKKITQGYGREEHGPTGAYAYLLESVEGGEKWGRYSFLGANPSLVFRCRGRKVEVIRDGQVGVSEATGCPLEVLQGLISGYRQVKVAGLPRFVGGAVGYLSYDMVRFFERLPEQTIDDLGLPDAVFMFTDTILIFDNVSLKIKVVHNAHLDSYSSPKAAYREAQAQIDATIQKLRTPVEYRPLEVKPPGAADSHISSNMTKAGFQAAVICAKEYVKAGDIIQVVLSQRLERQVKGDTFAIYRALRSLNPSPYMFYLELGGLKLVGSSPEVLVRVEEGVVETRPIAGTRPRGRDEVEDRALEQELLASEKERAEHLMLVDLGRNDIGRVAKTGSVEVPEFMGVERYSHVMHLVTQVRGQLDGAYDIFQALAACFPAGTVSGAPKVRAMEIIEELEHTRRGPYAGAVGYFSFTGNLDTCITIRTILIRDGVAYVQAGAGIVADSEPEMEYQETLNKAQGMLQAIELAEG